MGNYFSKLNDEYSEFYASSTKDLERVAEICQGLSGEAGKYFGELSGAILKMIRLETDLENVLAGSAEELEEINRSLFNWKRTGNYQDSWANPQVTVGAFGSPAGQILSALYYSSMSHVPAVFSGRRFELAHVASTAAKCFESVLPDGNVDADPLGNLFSRGMQELGISMDEFFVLSSLDPDLPFFRRIIESAAEETPRHLYRYGCHIGEHELRTSRFFDTYEEKALNELGRTVIEALERGFVNEGKELAAGSSLMLQLPVGYEKLAGIIIDMLRQRDLKTVITPPSATRINRQANLDHRFDATLWLDESYVDRRLEHLDSLMSEHAGLAEKCRGMIVVTFFGEKPFSPQSKPESLKPGKEQMELFRKYQSGMMMVREKYMPRKNMGFTIISFPSPEIGDRFEGIFADTVKMNCADNDFHRRMQRELIGIMDGAEYLRIRGADSNRTDLRVALQKSDDCHRSTIFNNCLADTNIPAGEIFTSPQLKGTDGLLHVETVRLGGISFRDLEITFQDGMTTGYTCSNFDSRDEGEKFVREQLFFPHSELPVGEFAIGTNTLAYEMAMKYGIMDLLPVLIIEKMGPHLAIGDTCYAYEEEQTILNPDGREVVAKENEFSSCRKQDPEKAYANTHIDISIPYHMIASISAEYPDGSAIDIIRDGRFVPDPVSELNQPIDRLGR